MANKPIRNEPLNAVSNTLPNDDDRRISKSAAHVADSPLQKRPYGQGIRGIFGDSRLSDLEAELRQFALNARRTQSGLSTLISWISARRAASICGRGPRPRPESRDRSERQDVIWRRATQ